MARKFIEFDVDQAADMLGSSNVFSVPRRQEVQEPAKDVHEQAEQETRVKSKRRVVKRIALSFRFKQGSREKLGRVAEHYGLSLTECMEAMIDAAYRNIGGTSDVDVDVSGLGCKK